MSSIAPELGVYFVPLDAKLFTGSERAWTGSVEPSCNRASALHRKVGSMCSIVIRTGSQDGSKTSHALRELYIARRRDQASTSSTGYAARSKLAYTVLTPMPTPVESR